VAAAVVGLLRTPALVCIGAADPWSTAPVTEELVACLAQPRTVVLEGVGHLPNLEAPGEFNEALLDFLAANRAPSR
jgi:pimeloyl-ACP methyl ester carboxylesterase